MIRRPRRNRKNAVIRALAEENVLSVSDFIFPVFVTEGKNQKTEIGSMPGIYRFTTDLILKEVEECMNLGVKVFAPFPNIAENLKDKFASHSHQENNLYTRTIQLIKENFPEAVLMTDIAMDPYSSEGHDGIVENGEILNDETLVVLGKMALAQAQAGSDILGPSDMMDGRIGYIRNLLDANNFQNVSIMAYSAKYASAFYGPFRDALESAPKFGDKKTYQMNPANVKEALLEAQLDFDEGADFLMVKPALPYLDVIKTLHDHFNIPIAAYNVSGEYAMIKAAGLKGWIDPTKAMVESLLSIKRAGAKIILTYFAKEFALLNKS